MFSNAAKETPAAASKTTPVESPRNSSSLDKCLPLYEELQCSEHHDDVLPRATSTSAEVACFLLHLLVSSEAMPLNQGRRVAARWITGTGQELHSYPPVMYLDIFRAEDG